MSTRDVKCGVPRLEVFSHREKVLGMETPIGWTVHGFLNSININPTEIRPEFFIIRCVIVNNMLVGPDNMLIGPDGGKKGQWLE